MESLIIQKWRISNLNFKILTFMTGFEVQRHIYGLILDLYIRLVRFNIEQKGTNTTAQLAF